MSDYSLALWTPYETEIIPSGVNSPNEITECAKQLSTRDRKQIIAGFQSHNFEMVVNFVWTKAMAALKRELGTVGLRFLGEMLNKPDLDEEDDVIDSITDKEAIRLAEELGVVSSTEGMRLRHAQELVAHFSKIDPLVIDRENVEMEEIEAIQALKTCVRNILGKPKIEVATKFIEFRDALESETLQTGDQRVEELISSPYFFRKLTVSVLMSIIKKQMGAKLENALANFNLLAPQLWEKLRDTERWQIGHTYAEVYAAGQSTAMSGMMQALLKVKGFDYVPENLRSNTFIKAAENLVKAHENMNNFYNEEAPMRVLTKLGSTIPIPALSICASAILAVRLGNYYGVSYAASPMAEKMLSNLTNERWQYYLNQCLPGDMRILRKLEDDKPLENWFNVVDKYELANLNIKNKEVNGLLKASVERDKAKTRKHLITLLEGYYGKKKN